MMVNSLSKNTHDKNGYVYIEIHDLTHNTSTYMHVHTHTHTHTHTQCHSHKTNTHNLISRSGVGLGRHTPHHKRGFRSLQNLVVIAPKILLTSADLKGKGYKGNNSEIGYSVQGLVAKVKDTVVNG